MTEEQINEALGKEISRRYNWIQGQVRTKIARDSMSEYADDLLHHIIIDLYKKTPEYKLDILNNQKVENWILVACGFQLRSGQSPFYAQFRKFKMSSRSGVLPEDPVEDEELPSIDEMFDCLLKCLDTLNVYEKTIIEKKYFEKWTYDQICDHYQISKTHLTKDTQKVILKIREFCKQQGI
jgi:RNA polymerase sigma factor (sigma-70 family)